MGEKRDQIIHLSDQLTPLEESVRELADSISEDREDERAFRLEENELIDRLEQLSREMNIPIELPAKLNEDLADINLEIDQYCIAAAIVTANVSCFPALSTEEITFSAITGLLSIIIDVTLVGTPEVVRIYRGGQRFDGSILTSAIRKIGNGDDIVSAALQWLSDKCKVPYDISAKKGCVTPDNHRLRSFAHDPFLGLFFAVADIIMGTTTCINNAGQITVLVSKPVPISEKLLSVFYYIGHILSDLCTARGIPIPGFFLTQFFTGEDGSQNSIARIAERMYKDGYDIRHLASMSVPVVVKDMLTDAYLNMAQEDAVGILSVAEKEYRELSHRLKREKMLFVANTIGVGGNLIKFLIPPNCGNPCALNTAQWFSFVRGGMNLLSAATRDRTGEIVMEQRKAINLTWTRLWDNE